MASARRALALAFTTSAAFLLMACGGQSPSAPSPSSSVPASGTGSTTTTAAATTPSLTYTGSVPNLRATGGYSFSVSFNVVLGAATTSTVNETPGYVAVVAPVSGTATLTNTSNGYTASESNYPSLEVAALYPMGDSVCFHQGEAVPSTGDVPVGHTGTPFHAVVAFYGSAPLCALRVAQLNPPLSAACGGSSSVESLSGGQGLDLVVTPDGSQGGGECEQQDDPGYLVLSGLSSGDAASIVSDLHEPPKYWAVLSPDGDMTSCPQSARTAQKEGTGQFSTPDVVPVVISEPGGLRGCVV